MTRILNNIQKRIHTLIKKTPTKLSLPLSLFFSTLSGYFYLIDNMLAAALTLALSSLFAAQKKDNKSKDRARDAFIFTGITLNPNIPLNLGLITMAAVIFLPHLASLRQTLSKRKIEPKISRTHTDMILIASTIIAIFIRPALHHALLLITALSIYSFIDTQFRTYKNRPKKE